MRKLLMKDGFAPIQATTDKLRSYRAAFREIGLTVHHESYAGNWVTVWSGGVL